MTVSQLFVNHYEVKLNVYPPNFDIFLVVIFVLLSFLTFKKTVNDQPLSFSHTEQVKGIAILLIVFNHLCYYTDPRPSLYAIWSQVGMVGVAIFLILSGYGLCISLEKKGSNNFFLKRTSRIFIPLTYSMLLLLGLYIIFVPNMQNNIFLEIPRIFFLMESLDRKTWFIIFILLWYCLLYLTFKFNFSHKQRLLFLFSISLLIITVPEFSYVAKGNALSFPVGCLLGFKSDIIKDKISNLLHQDIKKIALFLMGLLLFSGFIYWIAETLKYQAYQSSLALAIISVLISTLYLVYLYYFKGLRKSISLENICFVFVASIIY